jgi:hypothetical protein
MLGAEKGSCMRWWVRGALGSSFGAVAMLAAGVAPAGAPPRIQGDFVVQDDTYSGDVAVVEVDGMIHDVSGFIYGGGTGDDSVTIFFATPYPNTLSANPKTGTVKQNQYSQIRFYLTSAERALDLTVTPEKCAVTGTTYAARGKGRVDVRCSGPGLYESITADQLASIRAAFVDDKRVKIKVTANDPAKGSLSIEIKGSSFPEQ